jgi:hypothetical protein
MRFMNLGLLFVQLSRPLCPFSWGFMESCTGLMGFLASRWVGNGSVFITSASYSQDVYFNTLLHIGQGSLAPKVATVIALQPYHNPQ